MQQIKVTYVIDAKEQLGHPTKKHDWVKKMLKRNKATIIASCENIQIIKLKYKVFKRRKTVTQHVKRT